MLEATTAIGEVLVCFTVKLYSRKIFSYVFCVRKYFYNEKKLITVFQNIIYKVTNSQNLHTNTICSNMVLYIHLVSTTTKNK